MSVLYIRNKETGKFEPIKSIDGITPNITFEAVTGPAGSDVILEQSGTVENPVIKLTIPRGDTGSVDGIDYYEGNPAALGTASPGTANGVARGNHVHPMPTAADVGARPNTWMPTASDVGARPNTWMPTAADVGALSKDGTAENASKLGGVDASQYAKKTDLDGISGLPDGGTAGQVLTKSSDANQDADWQDPSGGGVEMTLLWMNASQTSSFAAQTVALDLSNYDGVYVTFRYDTSVTTRFSEYGAVGYTHRSSAARVFTYSDKQYFGLGRTFTVSTQGVEFASAVASTTSGGFNLNGCAIPVMIYGVKGVPK